MLEILRILANLAKFFWSIFPSFLIAQSPTNTEKHSRLSVVFTNLHFSDFFMFFVFHDFFSQSKKKQTWREVKYDTPESLLATRTDDS